MSVPLHSVESAPRAFQWHGGTTVSDRLPVRNHLAVKSAADCGDETGKRASAQCTRALKTCVRIGVHLHLSHRCRRQWLTVSGGDSRTLPNKNL